MQENHGSSNHGTAIYNAYQVTLYFSKKGWLFRENDGSLCKAQELGGDARMHMEISLICQMRMYGNVCQISLNGLHALCGHDVRF